MAPQPGVLRQARPAVQIDAATESCETVGQNPGNFSESFLEAQVKSTIVLLLALGCAIAASSAWAHHGVAGYDMEKIIVVTGTVTSFDWANPHCLVHIDAKDDKGETRTWLIELAAPTLMARAGWSKDSMKPGDSVVAETHPARNGVTTGLSATASVLLKFVVNGHELPTR